MWSKGGKAIARMTESIIRELREQNERLQTLLVSLSAALLRKTATVSAMNEPFTGADAERFVAEAEECFRCTKIPGLKQEIAEGLKVAGNELMYKAVDIETKLQRLKKRT